MNKKQEHCATTKIEVDWFLSGNSGQKLRTGQNNAIGVLL
jgi:hypothetical protein